MSNKIGSADYTCHEDTAVRHLPDPFNAGAEKDHGNEGRDIIHKIR